MGVDCLLNCEYNFAVHYQDYKKQSQFILLFSFDHYLGTW